MQGAASLGEAGPAAQAARVACGFPPPGLTGRLLPWALGGDCGCQAAVIPVPLASEHFSS